LVTLLITLLATLLSIYMDRDGQSILIWSRSWLFRSNDGPKGLVKKFCSAYLKSLLLFNRRILSSGIQPCVFRWMSTDVGSTCYLHHAGFLLGLFFDTENGSDTFFRNICWLSTDYVALYPRRQISS
jgi:hypothetical protein